MVIAVVAVSPSSLPWWHRELLSARLTLLLSIDIATELLKAFYPQKSLHLSDMDTAMLSKQATHFPGDPRLLEVNQIISSIPCDVCLCPFYLVTPSRAHARCLIPHHCTPFFCPICRGEPQLGVPLLQPKHQAFLHQACTPPLIPHFLKETSSPNH